MILLNINIPKKTYSQERADRKAAEIAIMESQRMHLTNGSLCCHATIRVLYQPKAMENEVRTIKVCTNCKSEAPNLDMFQEWGKVPKFFIELNNHKTENKNGRNKKIS